MDLSVYFKSIVDSDPTRVIVCDLNHTIIYMNPAASRFYESRGVHLLGGSLLDCHSSDSNDKIKAVVKWFGESRDNNRIFTFYNPKENKDVYMAALRNENGKLIGYYEKHEYRTPETAEPYVSGGESILH